MESTIELNQWMTLLREDIRDNIPIIYLAIPGSHNSMTFGINRKSQLAPDADKTIRRTYRILPWFVRRWARTQNYTATEQLVKGIRFFDLRIAKKNTVDSIKDKTPITDQTNVYYFVHGLFAVPVENVLSEINKFLEENPGEVVMLDFQHFYNMGIDDHLSLYKNLINIFGDKIYGPFDGELADLTLTKALQRKKQIIIIYRSGFSAPALWEGNFWPTPWPRTASLKKLEEFLKLNILNRKPGCGYVSQCVLTPDGKYIMQRFWFSLFHTAKKVGNYLEKWIEEQTPGTLEDGKSHVNVFIADYIDIKDSMFTHLVINLNNKLPVSKCAAENGDTKLF